jgi:hypothetical protein
MNAADDPTPINRAPLWLSLLYAGDGLVVALVVGSGFGFTSRREFPGLVPGAVLAFLPYAVIAAFLRRGSSAIAWELSRVLLVLTLVLAGGWLSLLALGLGMSSGPLSGSEILLFLTAPALMIAQLVLTVLVRRGADSNVDFTRSERSSNAFRLKLAGAIVLFYLLLHFLS